MNARILKSRRAMTSRDAMRRSMGSIVLKSLSVLLGIFFVFVGTMKLTSHISKDLHKDLSTTCLDSRLVFNNCDQRNDQRPMGFWELRPLV
ncbi:hypothetical protein HZH66_008704 [Vespula vulgaris]|uniref:Novel acetylcholine receptor chaperone n=1 Tax=Vespula vulgaris TaxID=7454 RepID=A0A834JQV4_VESVU|nr:hypothetical protein HZH66_008704 [Vespula vulgaris]